MFAPRWFFSPLKNLFLVRRLGNSNIFWLLPMIFTRLWESTNILCDSTIFSFASLNCKKSFKVALTEATKLGFEPIWAVGSAKTFSYSDKDLRCALNGLNEKEKNILSIEQLFVCLIDLVLYVFCKQLMLCRGLVSYPSPHCFLGLAYQYLAHIFLGVGYSTNALSLVLLELYL